MTNLTQRVFCTQLYVIGKQWQKCIALVVYDTNLQTCKHCAYNTLRLMNFMCKIKAKCRTSILCCVNNTLHLVRKTTTILPPA